MGGFLVLEQIMLKKNFPPIFKNLSFGLHLPRNDGWVPNSGFTSTPNDLQSQYSCQPSINYLITVDSFIQKEPAVTLQLEKLNA
jgi:hypothetical protein